MAKQLGVDRCFHCQEPISTLEEFSIEHKEPWLDSDDPINKFFDLDNIAFSHLKCNVKAARRYHKIDWPEGQAWCPRCQTMLPIENFAASKPTARNGRCRKCNRTMWHDKGYAERRRSNN